MMCIESKLVKLNS